MTLTLDPAAESLLQQELQRGRFADANELITHALHLVEAEHAVPTQTEMDDWLTQNKDFVRRALEESCAARDRGEGYTADEVRAHLAARRDNNPKLPRRKPRNPTLKPQHQ